MANGSAWLGGTVNATSQTLNEAPGVGANKPPLGGPKSAPNGMSPGRTPSGKVAVPGK